jgi:hypothetical protein
MVCEGTGVFRDSHQCWLGEPSLSRLLRAALEPPTPRPSYVLEIADPPTKTPTIPSWLPSERRASRRRRKGLAQGQVACGVRPEIGPLLEAIEGAARERDLVVIALNRDCHTRAGAGQGRDRSGESTRKP